MNQVYQELERLSKKAKSDIILKKKLLATRNAVDPLDEFCKLSCKAGCHITIGDLFALGLDDCDKQCKSTNGGNPSPYESFNDAYETFLASL